MKVFPCKGAENLPSTWDSNFLSNRWSWTSIAIFSISELATIKMQDRIESLCLQVDLKSAF